MMKIDLRIPPRAVTALLAVVTVYISASYAITVHYGQQKIFSLFLYANTVLLASAVLLWAFVIIRCLSVMVLQRPRHLTQAILADLQARLFNWNKFNAAWPIYIGFILLMSVFSSMKSMIPVLVPYHWDDAFIRLDRIIHGGVDPWRLLQPVMGNDIVTPLTNAVYNNWFMVMFGLLFWQLFDLRRPELRLRFFWAFFLIWIVVGTIFATVFSSTGPCFYEHFTQGINPFSEQMKYLRDLDQRIPVWALGTQDSLWASYSNHKLGIGTGISAMPSVHVATTTLFLLLAWQYGKWMRAFFFVFWIFIMAGSVHLAWHYAVDGYAGALMTVFMWWIAGYFLRNASSGVAKGRSSAGFPVPSE